MSEPRQPSPDLALTWESQVIGWIPLPPALAGMTVGVGLAVAATAFFATTGAPIVVVSEGSVAISPDFTTAAVVSLLVGYTMAAGRFLDLTIARDLVAAGRMRAEILSPDNVGFLHGQPRRAVRRSRIPAAFGFALGIAMVGVIGSAAGGSGALFDGVTWSDAWTIVLTPVLMSLLARAGYMTTLGARERTEERFGIAPGEIDLLDMRRHLVEGRIGLRLALVWIVGISISSLMISNSNRFLLTVPLMVFAFGIAAVALVLPVRRLHLRIRDAKRHEMQAVRTRLAATRDAVMRGDPGANGRLADLLAYADHLNDVREWPFDNRTLSRFVLYLLIPLGSWLGGALVERLVGRILD
jgi:hypothetical protein